MTWKHIKKFGGGVNRRQGRGIKKERGSMNRAERDYANHLENQVSCGRVLWWRFEPCNFELAERTFWRPDFLVMTDKFEIEVHEVKAKWKNEDGPHLEDHAKVRIKVFSEMYPFRVKILWRHGGVWRSKTVGPE